jgi:hypothetical protein
MSTLEHAAFLILAATFVFLGLAAWIRLGMWRHETKLGILRDGLPAGTAAPRWDLRDVAGVTRRSPAQTWQLLLFIDYSLVEFPETVRAFAEFARETSEVEVLALSERPADPSQLVFHKYGLTCPVMQVDHYLYHRYNVSKLPFAIFIDRDGVVRARGLVTLKQTLQARWKDAQQHRANSTFPKERIPAAIA